MKLCIFSDSIYPDKGGIERTSYELPIHLSSLRKVEKIDVIGFCDSKEGIEKVNNKLTIYRFKKRRGLLKIPIIIREFLKRKEFDIFHSITILPSGFYLSILSKIFKKPFFVNIHGLDVLSIPKKGLIRMMASFVLRNSFILFNSNSTKAKVIEEYDNIGDNRVIYPSSKIIQYNKSKVDNLRKKYNIKKDDFIVLFVGRLVKRKGVGDLIKAISLLKDKKIRLFIVGDGPERQKLERIVKRLKLSERVVFAGRVPSVDEYYYLSDVFCMPSKHLVREGDVEGFGMVFLEAQSAGKPCIGTSSGGIPEAIKDNYSGFIVKEGSPKEIKEKIFLLYKDKGLYKKMSRNAKKWARGFSFDVTKHHYLDFFLQKIS